MANGATMTGSKLGGEFTFPGTGMTVRRMGYGAMRLSGPGIYGPPADRAEAVRVLRTAIEAGVNHIDTSDFYGPHVTNQIIREALHPYPKDLVLVTKVGARRTEDKAWHEASSKEELVSAVEDNLRNLGVEQLQVVNFRVFTHGKPNEGPVSARIEVLAELQRQGKIAHIGISTATMQQVKEAQGVAPIVCVQNEYNVVKREDDAMIAELGRQGIAYVPYFPLGGFSLLQGEVLDRAAKTVGGTVLQVALAWVMGRGENVLAIPGTSSVGHLRENLAASELVLPDEVVKELDGLAGSSAPVVAGH